MALLKIVTVRPVWLFLALMIFGKTLIYAQSVQYMAMPKIQHYSRADYNAYNQNWSIAQAPDGIMYFANSKGLLAYNGSEWQLYELPMKQVIRTVATDNEGRIYTGGYAEIGYWEKPRYGKLSYHSYGDNISYSKFKQEEIWNIAVIGNEEIIFQSLTTIYYSKKGAIKVLSTGHSFTNVKVINGKVFILSDEGLYEYKNNILALVAGSISLNGGQIAELIPYAFDQLLAITSGGNTFIYNHKQFKAFESEAESFLRDNGVTKALRIDENKFAFSTFSKGVIITDGFGRIIHKLNLNTGLASNTALSLFSDQHSDLWIGLEGGISNVLLQSPFTQFKDRDGQMGVVYSAGVYHGAIYLATSHGLFSKTLTDRTGTLVRVHGIADPVTSLEIFDEALLFSSTTGMYEVKDNTLRKISDVGVAWVIKRFNQNPDYFIQGSYYGLVIYKKQQGKWRIHAKLHSNEWLPARDLDFDKQGNIWMKHLYHGIYKITLSADKRSIIKTKQFNADSGLPKTGKLNIFKYNNDVRVSNSSGIYKLVRNDRFVPDVALEKILGPYFYAKRIISTFQPEWWMIMDDNSIARVKWLKNGKTEFERFKQRNFYLLNDYEHIRRYITTYLFCTEDGFSLFDDNMVAKANSETAPLINEINVLQNSIYEPIGKYDTAVRPRLAYNQNSISVSWGMPLFDSQKLYSYRVVGTPEYKDWSTWSPDFKKQFDNLSSGKYTFQVRSDLNRQITSFEFEILPPWYLTFWAKIYYVVVFLSLGIFLYRTHRKKLAEQKKQFEIDAERRMRQERINHEHLLMQVEQQKLAQQVEMNSRHLANSSLNLVKKNEFLNRIKTSLNNMKEESGGSVPTDKINRVIKMINTHTSKDKDMQLFDESFERVHNSFFNRLLQAYPDLAPQDLKLAAYLKMNLSTKEIAPLLQISPRGVEIKRYRLRKRLKLNSDQNLIEFMMTI